MVEKKYYMETLIISKRKKENVVQKYFQNIALLSAINAIARLFLDQYQEKEYKNCHAI